MPDDRKNIAFIGLTGCGKTTVSQRVAGALSMPWYDCDAEIERAEVMSVADIFAQKGEQYFRAAEAAHVRALCGLSGAVIALGGGAVLHSAALLKQRAVVVYLRRGAAAILRTLDTATRPMLRDDPARLYALEKERRAVYEGAADITVDNEGTVEAAVGGVLEALTRYRVAAGATYDHTPRTRSILE